MALKDEILAAIAAKIEGQGTAVDAGSALPGILRGIVDYIDGIAAGIPAAQIQSDWTQADNTKVDFIKNKPTIPAAQVNADWNAESGVAQILNKPTIPAGALVVEGTFDNEGAFTPAAGFSKNDATEAYIAGRPVFFYEANQGSGGVWTYKICQVVFYYLGMLGYFIPYQGSASFKYI